MIVQEGGNTTQRPLKREMDDFSTPHSTFQATTTARRFGCSRRCGSGTRRRTSPSRRPRSSSTSPSRSTRRETCVARSGKGLYEKMWNSCNISDGECACSVSFDSIITPWSSFPPHQVNERTSRAGASSPEGLRQQGVLRGCAEEGGRHPQAEKGRGRAGRRARRRRGLHPGGGEDQVLEVPRAAGEGHVRTALQGRGDTDRPVSPRVCTQEKNAKLIHFSSNSDNLYGFVWF